MQMFPRKAVMSALGKSQPMGSQEDSAGLHEQPERLYKAIETSKFSPKYGNAWKPQRKASAART
jgi:hypothetical protein